jgi:hypothetical protein
MERKNESQLFATHGDTEPRRVNVAVDFTRMSEREGLFFQLKSTQNMQTQSRTFILPSPREAKLAVDLTLPLGG